jgi:hypothetical protein
MVLKMCTFDRAANFMKDANAKCGCREHMCVLLDVRLCGCALIHHWNDARLF